MTADMNPSVPLSGTGDSSSSAAPVSGQSTPPPPLLRFRIAILSALPPPPLGTTTLLPPTSNATARLPQPPGAGFSSLLKAAKAAENPSRFPALPNISVPVAAMS